MNNAANILLFSLLTLASTVFAQQWTSTTPLPDTYVGQSLAYYNGYLYQAGGASGYNGILDGTNVFYSQVYSNGIVGTWNHVTSLPEDVLYHAGVEANGFLYVLGGDSYNDIDGYFITSNVYYAKINSDGSLNSWQTANPLPQPLAFPSASVWNNTIYLIGGYNGDNLVSNVYSAKIQADGSLSAWVSQASLPIAIYTQASVANGFLYVLSGITDGGSLAVNSVYYSKINSNGTLAGWNQTTPLPQPQTSFGAVAAEGRLFSIAGNNGNTPINSFYVATVSGDGTLGAWLNGASLPQPNSQFGFAASDSYIFVTGGASTEQNLSTVYSMALPAAPGAPGLTCSNLVNGTFNLRLTSTQTNTGFGLLASTNLTSWTNIGWGFTDTNGLLQFQDTNAASFPNRFYRAYWPLP